MENFQTQSTIDNRVGYNSGQDKDNCSQSQPVPSSWLSSILATDKLQFIEKVNHSQSQLN